MQITSTIPDNQYFVNIISSECQQANPNIGTCTGTMGITEQDIEVLIESPR